MLIKADSTIVLCLEWILRPVVRFCLKRSIKYQEFDDVAKRAFVRVAQEEIQKIDEQESALRLSAMTGIQRRDITRLKVGGAPAGNRGRNLVLRVIGVWSLHRRYRDSKGHPRILSAEGKQSDFAKLVHSISTDMNPYAVLFELERIGAVVRDGERAILKRSSYEPVPGEVLEAFELLSSDSDDLIEAVSENALGVNPEPNLHAKTVFDNINPDALPKIRAGLLKKGAAFHKQIREFLGQFDKDISPKQPKGGARVVVGTFSHSSERGEKGES